MLRVCLKGANSAARKCLCGKGPSHPLQQCRRYTAGESGGSAGKIAAATVVTLGGGVGGTVLYANWDPKFRTSVEQNVPYSASLFGMALGPIPATVVPVKKQLELPSLMFDEKKKKEESPAPETSPTTQTLEPAPEAPEAAPEVTEESSLEASFVISGLSEVPCVPAPHDTEITSTQPAVPEECHHHEAPAEPLVLEAPPPPAGEEPLKERPVEEVSARLAQQDLAEQDSLTALSASLEDKLAASAKAALHAIGAQEAALLAIAVHTSKLKEAMEAESPPDQKSAQWKDLEAALNDRSHSVDEAGAALLKAKEALETLRSVIDQGKASKVDAVRPLVLAAEENLHSMVVDLDHVVTKVQSAQSEAKIVSQYSDLVNEAKQQFQKELSSITPEVQANWKGLSKLTPDDLNSLIAHAHRRIDQLNREMAEQRVRAQIHMETALEQQRLEDQKMLEQAVGTALEHSREEARLEQERKLVELREVMEAEMRTQLRRQAAAHTDHLRDVLKVQEQELRAEAEEVLSGKLLEQETVYRRLTQEQLDNFTLDMNAAYARLKGMEEAIDSHVIAEEEARKAHMLWLSVEGLNFALRTSGADTPTEPLDGAAAAVRDSCAADEFAAALAGALPEEAVRRGVYSEASLRARFYALRALTRRVALIDETHNSLFQYFLSYLQAALLFEELELPPPAQLTGEDLDPFKILSYATYSLERGDLELAAKLVNQLRGEARRVVGDWLVEARLTLETRQVVGLLSAYANAVGLGTTQAP